jgi:cytochrome c-type biogenesis protein CcmH
MIDQMVEGLANKLKSNPKDADGWVRLLRSRMTLGQDRQAGDDLVVARKALAGDPTDLAKVEAAAGEFKVPGSR